MAGLCFQRLNSGSPLICDVQSHAWQCNFSKWLIILSTLKATIYSDGQNCQSYEKHTRAIQYFLTICICFYRRHHTDYCQENGSFSHHFKMRGKPADIFLLVYVGRDQAETHHHSTGCYERLSVTSKSDYRDYHGYQDYPESNQGQPNNALACKPAVQTGLLCTFLCLCSVWPPYMCRVT